MGMRNSDRWPPRVELEDLQREFPDWDVVMDRDFTGRCFAYLQGSGVTLSSHDPSDLRDQIRDWLRKHH